MTIEQYLFHLYTTRFLLIAGCAAAGDRQGLDSLEEWEDVRVCCSPALHRPYYRYAGQGRFTCEVCSRIKVA